MEQPPPEQRIPQPKILLEGTSLTSKTDTAFALAEHPRIIGQRLHRWHIPLVSSEWETRANAQPTKGQPGSSMITFRPEEEPWALEAFHTYLRLFELHVDYYWIVDRFHLSTISYQRTQFGRECDLRWVDERLAAAGFRLVTLTRRPDSFEAAREERLVYSENPWRYTDLDKLIRDQEAMRELGAASCITSTEIDVTDLGINETADRIIDWVEATDGMYRPPDRSEILVQPVESHVDAGCPSSTPPNDGFDIPPR
ncbi:MAG TPA: hypothetical protein PKE05_13270 [Microthrixaceae bacterium]|jgi:hypothetical protein|nr:hypothetical protein [Microthrixaceae bacterium]